MNLYKTLLITLRLAVLLGCFVGFIFQALEFVKFYYEYQTTVEIKIESIDKIPLPAVTFCWSRYNFSHWCIIRPDDCLSDFSGDEKFRKWNRYIQSLKPTEMKGAGVQVDKFLVKCSFEEDDNCQPIYQTHTTFYGNCFTINSDWIPTAAVRNLSGISKMGRSNKIPMYFYLYLNPNISLPAVNTAVVSFSPPDSIPDIKYNKYKLEPGKAYTFSVSQSISHMLPPPYVTNCTDYDKMGRASFRGGLLTQQTCMMECIANVTLKVCGCVYIDYPYIYELPGPVRPCIVRNERGVCKKTPLFSKEIDATHYCNDLCRTSCRAVSYEISFYKQPLIISNTSDETTTRKIFQDFLKKPISLETLRLTGVRVNILVKNKELLVYHHHPRYQDVELFSYIGGYIGIWLGISLANVLEVIRNCAVKAKDWFLDLKELSSNIIKMIRETLASIHVIQI